MKMTFFGVAAVLFAALLPFVDSDQVLFGALNTRMFFIVAFVDIIAVWAAYRMYRTQSVLFLKHQWLLYALGVTLLAYIISSYTGVFFERSLWSDIRRASGVFFLTHVALLGVLLSVFLSARDWSSVRRAAALSTAAFGVLFLAGTLFGFEEKVLWLNFSLEGFTFGNSTFAGVYLLIAFVLTLVELASSWGERRWRWTLGVSALAIALSPTMLNIEDILLQFSNIVANPIHILGAARASSATMLLLFAFVCGYLLIRHITRNRTSILRTRLSGLWAVGMIVGISTAVGLLFAQGSPVQDAYIDASTGARILVWEAGFDAFMDKPLFGWGPENFRAAFVSSFDNRLYLSEFIGEVWFDRAHNIFVDTLVSVGIVGAGALLLLTVLYIRTFWRAQRAGLIGHVEAVLMIALVPAHILQLQTGFDTIASYALLGIVMGYALWLERQLCTRRDSEAQNVRPFLNKSVALILVVFAVVSFKFIVIDEYNRQRSLMNVFRTTDFDKQQEYVQQSFSRVSDFEGLRLSTESFIGAVLDGVGQVQDRERFIELVLIRMNLYEDAYETYLATYPNDYRARMNFAYLLVVKTTLGENELARARDIVENSYELSPGNPLTPALHALVELYGGHFDTATDRANDAVALNPGVDFSIGVREYVEAQQATFPRISVLRIVNL